MRGESHGGAPLQAAPHTDNCFKVLFQDVFQIVFQVLFLGRFSFCFRALAWFCFWALAKSLKEAPKRLPAGPERGPKRSELRGCRRRNWPEYLSSGGLGTQSCEDVSGESCQTTMGQGISEVSVARMSQAKVA